VTVIFVRVGEDESFRVGLSVGGECFLSSLGLIVAVGEEEQSGLFVLEDLFDGGLVKWNDRGVNVEGQKGNEDKNLSHVVNKD
jgi:hypothetical protein